MYDESSFYNGSDLSIGIKIFFLFVCIIVSNLESYVIIIFIRIKIEIKIGIKLN
jgi:hypothetical protein